MGKTQKRLFLWAGIIAAITAGLGIVVLIVMNYIIPNEYSKVLDYLQNDLGVKSSFGTFKSYINTELLVMTGVNSYLAYRYISFSKMTLRQLSSRGSSLIIILIINAFCGGNIITLILAIIGMLKPITPDFNEKTIREIDRELLDRNPNTISMIIKIKQDKLNGVITEEEYAEKLNKILEDEARRYL